MAEKPIKDEPGADERFDRAIKNALKMPVKNVRKTVARETVSRPDDEDP